MASSVTPSESEIGGSVGSTTFSIFLALSLSDILIESKTPEML